MEIKVRLLSGLDFCLVHRYDHLPQRRKFGLKTNIWNLIDLFLCNSRSWDIWRKIEDSWPDQIIQSGWLCTREIVERNCVIKRERQFAAVKSEDLRIGLRFSNYLRIVNLLLLLWYDISYVSFVCSPVWSTKRCILCCEIKDDNW